MEVLEDRVQEASIKIITMAFETNITTIGEHAIIHLKDLSNNSFVELYSFGALLNQFSVVHEGTPLNVIEGFSDISDAIKNITPYFRSAKLSPFVCRVNKGSFTFGEKKYHLSKYMTNGNAIHGLIYDASFEIVTHEANDNFASVTLSYQYEKKEDGFPFIYKCEVEYKLESDNQLTVTTTITNADEKLIPVTDGWHPYFTLGDTIDEYQVEFQCKEMLVFDDALIPTGSFIPYETFGSLTNFGDTHFDNCFTLNFAECQPLCVIRNPKKKIQIEFHPSQSYPYLQIYTPDSRKSIAIENLSAAPDAFNNGLGLIVLSPKEQAVFSTKFKVKSI